MRTFLLAAVLALGPACSRDSGTSSATEHAAIALVSVDEVASKLASGACVPVDANGTGTRKKMGVVPGAVLLTDSEAYALSELPTDKAKELVFYCANTQCTASHDAAKRARHAGYQNVKVMGDGIAGWVKAGKQVQTL